MRLARLDKVLIFVCIRIEHEGGNLYRHRIPNKLVDMVYDIGTIHLVAESEGKSVSVRRKDRSWYLEQLISSRFRRRKGVTNNVHLEESVFEEGENIVELQFQQSFFVLLQQHHAEAEDGLDSRSQDIVIYPEHDVKREADAWFITSACPDTESTHR